MKILFIRHGQTTGDVENRYGGTYDDQLSPEGIMQAKGLIEELKDKKVDVVISSPLIRARETAHIVFGDATPVIIEAGLSERNRYGALAGQVKSEAAKEFPELTVQAKERKNTIDGAELYSDFIQRIQKVFDKITSPSDYESIAVVWHGGPTHVLFEDILQLGNVDYGDCAWVELEKVGDRFEVRDSRRMKFLF